MRRFLPGRLRFVAVPETSASRVALESVKMMARQRRCGGGRPWHSWARPRPSREPTPRRGSRAILVLAGAHCQLGQLVEATRHLGAALDAGSEEPVVRLVMGCCMCSAAAQACTGRDDRSGTRVVRDDRRYRTALLDAVSTLELGLSGGPLDPLLYWWMGAALSEPVSPRRRASRG